MWLYILLLVLLLSIWPVTALVEKSVRKRRDKKFSNKYPENPQTSIMQSEPTDEVKSENKPHSAETDKTESKENTTTDDEVRVAVFPKDGDGNILKKVRDVPYPFSKVKYLYNISFKGLIDDSFIRDFEVRDAVRAEDGKVYTRDVGAGCHDGANGRPVPYSRERYYPIDVDPNDAVDYPEFYVDFGGYLPLPSSIEMNFTERFPVVTDSYTSSIEMWRRYREMISREMFSADCDKVRIEFLNTEKHQKAVYADIEGYFYSKKDKAFYKYWEHLDAANPLSRPHGETSVPEDEMTSILKAHKEKIIETQFTEEPLRGEFVSEYDEICKLLTEET